MQYPGSFAYILTSGNGSSDIRSSVKRMYSKVDLDAEGIEIWRIDVLENERWVTKTFVCNEPLFTRLEDGSLRLNTEIKDVKGRDFPYQYLSELMEPELFSLPTGMN